MPHTDLQRHLCPCMHSIPELARRWGIHHQASDGSANSAPSILHSVPQLSLHCTLSIYRDSVGTMCLGLSPLPCPSLCGFILYVPSRSF